ncbi:hypothetical protein [Nocardia arthritidis]|uniref:Lipoprotein n=1 Tax=Nocardia arthritidis TaxID=228602 RepID=A0A6G9YBH5_9NOCA|nr:hypothetical protein [Nocardia arthritidis]QIS10518.1 hypothetical protein F5544_13145 [Nocardia arthritidis]
MKGVRRTRRKILGSLCTALLTALLVVGCGTAEPAAADRCPTVSGHEMECGTVTRPLLADQPDNVHDALVDGDRIAAHYILSGTMRDNAVIRTEIWMFGRLAPDGRVLGIDQITRTVPESPGTALK